MTDASRLGLVRAHVFLVAAAYVLMIPLERVAAFPPEAIEPLGLARLLPDDAWALLHGETVLALLRVGLSGLLLLCGLGVPGYRWLGPSAAALFFLHQILLRIDASGHRELALLYCVITLSAFPAADAWSVQRRMGGQAKHNRASYRAALLLTSFAFLFTYTAPALYRLVHAAPTIFLDDSFLNYIVANGGALRNGTSGFDYGSKLVAAAPSAIPLLKVGFVVSTVLEAFSLLCLRSRRFRYVWLGFCLGFHVVNLLLLNINFGLNMLLAPMLLIWGTLPNEELQAGGNSAVGEPPSVPATGDASVAAPTEPVHGVQS